MKKIMRSIDVGEKIIHKGTLEVVGDVSPGAFVQIIGGALIVHGAIGEDVKINLVTSNYNSYSRQPEIHKPKIDIRGSVGDRVKITSDAEIKIEGDIGEDCSITNNKGGLIANNIGDKTHILVRDDIIAKYVGNVVHLKSTMGEINVYNVGNSSKILCRNDVTIDREVGSRCYINITRGKLKVDALRGENTIVETRDDVNVNYIAPCCRLTVAMGKVKAKDVDHHVLIRARDDIQAQSVNYNAQLLTNMGKITVTGYVGNHCDLNGRDGVTTGDVGIRTKLTSNMGTVVTGSLGDHAVVSGRDGVRIFGERPKSVQANSSMGIVKHAFAPRQAFAFVPSYDLSKSPLKARAKIQRDIPEEYLCTLSGRVMENAVICMLDNKNYNRDDITAYLLEHRCVPGGTITLGSMDSVEDVLVANDLLQNTIDAYQVQADPNIFVMN